MLASRPGRLDALDARRVAFAGDDGGRCEISHEEAAILEACATFAPAAFHRARLVELSGWPASRVDAAFASLVERGLIAPASAFYEAVPSEDEPAPPPTIVVRSYERPAGLAHLLSTLSAGHRYAVVDDSLEPAAVARTQAIVREFASRIGSDVTLIDATNRNAWMRDVPVPLRALLDPDVPSAVTGSRTWNWAVLLAAGGSMAILDDDTAFPVRRFRSARGRIDLLDATEPVARWFDTPVDGPAAGQDARPSKVEVDAELPIVERPYETLRALVGRSPASLLAQFGADERYLAHRSPRELRVHDARHHILGAMPGTYGSIPLDSSAYLAALGESDLWREPYRHERLAATSVAQGTEAPRILSHANYTPMLMDARELLPFAGTWGRVDDTYFLAFANAIEPKAAWLFVPMLLGHRDYATRDRLARAIEPLKLDTNAYIAHRLTRFEHAATDRRMRLATVGDACGDWSESDFEEDLRGWRAGMFTRVASHVASALDRHPEAPAAWRAHAAKIVEANLRQAENDRPDASHVDHVRKGFRQIADAAPHWAGAFDRFRESPPAKNR